MATETVSEAQSRSRLRNAQRLRELQTPASSFWKHATIAVGLLLAVAIAAVLVASTVVKPQAGPRLYHTITRGDLRVTITEHGTLESAENTEIKCQVRGQNTVTWVIESGTNVQPGDELIRLDSLLIEEQIDERTKYAHWSRSSAERSQADMARAKLEVQEYEQGRYVAELMKQEKDLVIAESTLSSAENILAYTLMMAESGYVSALEVEEKTFAVEQAKLDVDVKRTAIDGLKRFTKAEEMGKLKGNVAATKANHAANAERALADASRRDRALGELEHCVVTAQRGGLVIHPNAARWENEPIAEGATVHKDQVLLVMPDLSQMQVKVGIHEDEVERVSVGLTARVTLPDQTLDGTVASVATVTKPAGWWTGNRVNYDTIIKLPSVDGLRPGMSAEVVVLIAQHHDVLTIPVAAIVESEAGDCCWVKTAEGLERRSLVLGDSNKVFTLVKQGLQEGDEVVLNPPGGLTSAATTTHDQQSDQQPAAKPTGRSNQTGQVKP